MALVAGGSVRARPRLSVGLSALLEFVVQMVAGTESGRAMRLLSRELFVDLLAAPSGRRIGLFTFLYRSLSF